ncbi:MAG: hypothetical protein NVV82_19850 [Sporocytophaga sp.]|nr:hypothetical protein [Sporocytophaga sp.]
MKNIFKTAIVLVLFSTSLSKDFPACIPGDYLISTALDSNKRCLRCGAGINLVLIGLFAINPTFDFYLRNSNSLIKQSLDFPIIGHNYEYIATNEFSFNFDYKINFTRNNYLYYKAPGIF